MSVERYIGVMSGTSMDAIDAVLTEYSAASRTFSTAAAHSTPIPQDLQRRLRHLSRAETVSVAELGHCDHEFGLLIAAAINGLLSQTQVSRQSISAIGSHGQTIRHLPDAPYPFSMQIGNPSVIAEATGIDVVADFRMADIAAGGQGAPLVPAFHRQVFSSSDHHRAIVNIGGIANVTLLSPAGEILAGFDIGPGNTLLDAWTRLNQRGEFDQDGAWARSGNVSAPMLQQLLADSYLSKAAPKSTGPEYFNLDWLKQRAAAMLHETPLEDTQRTLTEFSAVCISRSIQDLIHRYDIAGLETYCCGGGTRNGYLMERLNALLHPMAVETTAVLGIDPQMVEGAAFAWLAMATQKGLPGNSLSVTGAQRLKILGGFYPATRQANH